MPEMTITIADDRTDFRPGETLRGKAEWTLPKDVKRIEVNLYWFTSGQGDEDLHVVESTTQEHARRQDDLEFAFELPNGPYSFSGKLITLTWAVELVAAGVSDTVRQEITLSPTGQELDLSRERDLTPERYSP